MRVRSVPKLLAFPTAQALDEEMTVTPWRTFSWPPPVAAFGDATAFQPWQVADEAPTGPTITTAPNSAIVNTALSVGPIPLPDSMAAPLPKADPSFKSPLNAPI
jgi:hypothetical protein